MPTRAGSLTLMLGLALSVAGAADAQAQFVPGMSYEGSVQFNNVCTDGGQGFYSEPARVVADSKGDADYLFTSLTAQGVDPAGQPVPQGGIGLLKFTAKTGLWTEQVAEYTGTYSGYSMAYGSWSQTFTTGSSGQVTSTGTFNIFSGPGGSIVCTEPTNGTFIPMPKGL